MIPTSAQIEFSQWNGDVSMVARLIGRFALLSLMLLVSSAVAAANDGARGRFLRARFE
jgi:hypothetical protein